MGEVCTLVLFINFITAFAAVTSAASITAFAAVTSAAFATAKKKDCCLA